jgi:hypothetical protein
VVRRGETIADSIGDSMRDFRRLAASAEPLAGLASQLPALAATGEKVARLSQTDAFQNLMDSGLLERLGQKQTIQHIHQLLNHLETVSFSLGMLDGFIRRGEELVDNLAGFMAEARKAGASFDESSLTTLWDSLNALLQTARTLYDEGFLEELPKLTGSLNQLLRSGLLQPETIQSLAQLGQLAAASYANTLRASPQPAGALDIWRSLSDPDVRRSVGFLLGMAKQYGQLMR